MTADKQGAGLAKTTKKQLRALWLQLHKWIGLSLAILGLVLLEQVYRNAEADRRWSVKPLCLGLAAMYGFDLYLYAEALLLLEATASEEGKRHAWRYTLARMTSYRVVVQLDNHEVFAVTPYWKGPRSPSDPYVEASDGPFALEETASGNQNATRK